MYSVKILGCGGSLGVPNLCCDCKVCKSNDLKNKRSRASVLLSTNSSNLLIDSSVDFREQALANNVTDIDAVLYTHDHYDHTSGIGDLKPMMFDKLKRGIHTNCYMSLETSETMLSRYNYVFAGLETFGSTYSGYLKPVVFDNCEKMAIGDISFQTFPQTHGQNVITTGVRFGDIVYSTDLNEIPKISYKYLKGIKVWILDCMKYGYSPTHANFRTAMGWVEQFKPEHVILTHMSHDIDYYEIDKMSPSNVRPAIDGMVVQCFDDGRVAID